MCIMSFFGGRSPRLSTVDDFLPRKKKRNGNGKRNGKGRNGKGSAKEAAMGFESPGFFEGFSKPQNGGIPKADLGQSVGVSIPELGEGFNTRIGNIGTGFTEQVNPFKIGFEDILTGNGRTGEIIRGGAGGVTPALGKRKRGRPKGSGKKQKAIGSARATSKPLEFDTKGAAELRKSGKFSQIKTKSVGGLLAEGARRKAGALRDRLSSDSEFTSTSISLGEGEGRAESVVQEGEGVSFRERAEEGGVTFASPEEGLKNDLEDEDEGLDEDMDDVEDNDIDFEVTDDDEIRRKPKGGFVQ